MSLNLRARWLVIFFSLVIANVYGQVALSPCGLGIEEQEWEEGPLQSRPTFSNPVILPTEHFLIHYSLTDTNHETTQEWADTVAAAAEEAYAKLVARNWPLPPVDNPQSPQYDIYIWQIEGGQIDGVVKKESQIPGSNGWTSWMEVRKDPSQLHPTFPPLEYLKVIVAHEMHHVSQYTFQEFNSTNGWFWENCAVYWEREVYPGINILSDRFTNGNFTPNPLSDPQLSIDDNNDLYRYPGGIWAIYLEEAIGNGIILDIWQASGAHPDPASLNMWNIIDQVLQSPYYERTLSEALFSYSEWRYFTGSRDDNHHFSEAALWPSATTTTISSYPIQSQVGPLLGSHGSTVYYEFIGGSETTLALQFNGQDNRNWRTGVSSFSQSQQLEDEEMQLDPSTKNGFYESAWNEETRFVLSPVHIPLTPDNKLSGSFDYSASLEAAANVEFWCEVNTEPRNEGQFILDEQIPITSGQTRYFVSGSDYHVRLITERFEEPEEINKHSHWNNDFATYLFRRTQFDVRGDNHEVAKYATINLVNIGSTLLSTAGQGSLELDFRDPWYQEDDLGNQPGPDEFITYTTPFTPRGHYDPAKAPGVFLNVDVLEGRPFYECRAQENQDAEHHGEDFRWDFQGWTGNPNEVLIDEPGQIRTGVEFKVQGAQVNAVYKAHLAGNHNTITRSKGARQLARWQSATETFWLMTYEDAGNIYFTYSTNNGANWAKEEQVTPDVAGTVNTLPAIAVEESSTNPEITVVWRQQDGNGISYQWRSKNGPAGVWGDPSIFGITSPYSAQPAVAYSGDDAYLVIKGEDQLNNSGLFLFYLDEENEAVLVGQLPDSRESSQAVSLTVNHQNGNPLHMAWADGNEINYVAYNISQSAFQGFYPVSGLEEPLFPINHSPTVVVGLDGRPNVAWVGFDTELTAYVLLHRQRHSGNWLSINEVYYAYSNLAHPSLGAFWKPQDSGILRSTIEVNQNLCRILEFDGEAWSFSSGSYAGRYPTLSFRGDDLLMAYTESAPSAPFAIEPILQSAPSSSMSKGGHLATTSTMENGNGAISSHFRRERVTLEGLPTLNLAGIMAVDIGDPMIDVDGSRRQWPFLPDSLNNNRSGRFLRTRSLALGADMDTLRLSARVLATDIVRNGNLPNLPLFDIALVDSATDETLHLIERVPLSRLAEGRWTFSRSYAVPLRSFAGQTAYLRLASIYDRLRPGGVAPVRLSLFEFDGPANLAKSKGRPVNILSEPGRTFHLFPNYPNPFNPTTTISFVLPASGSVSLEVFDLSGRTVATLLSQTMEAGPHEVRWDGRDEWGNPVSSGVYLYRIRSGDFAKTRKMVLMK